MANGVVDEVDCLEKFRGESQGAWNVAHGLLCDGNGLKIATEECWRSGKCILDLGVCRCIALNPVQEGVHVKLVITNRGIDFNCNCSDFREVRGRGFAYRTPLLKS